MNFPVVQFSKILVQFRSQPDLLHPSAANSLQSLTNLRLARTPWKAVKPIFTFPEKNGVDLGVNIGEELEGLKKNLDLYKVSKIWLYIFVFRYRNTCIPVFPKAAGGGGGEFEDIDVQQLDWVEGDRKVKAFFIYETSL